MESAEHYRWNINPAWEHFSSLTREVAKSEIAPNDFVRYHHLKAALYFGMGAIEAFLNEKMRKRLTDIGTPEPEIFKKVRTTHFPEKLKKWPSVLAASPVEIPCVLQELISNYSEIRGEVTHPKARDHSVYRKLDQIKGSEVKDCVAEFIVRVQEAQQQKYAYWVFGWNFIGMNTDFSWPALFNNQQFIQALAFIGFDVPSFLVDPMEAWENEYMINVAGYFAIRTALEKNGKCEPRDLRFPFMPRLCKEWWNPAHTSSCGEVRELNLPRFC